MLVEPTGPSDQAEALAATWRILARMKPEILADQEDLLGARSRDIFGNGQVLVVWTFEDRAYPLGQLLVGAEQTAGLDHFAYVMESFVLYRIETQKEIGRFIG